MSSIVKDVQKKNSHSGIRIYRSTEQMVRVKFRVNHIGLVVPERYDCDSLPLLTVATWYHDMTRYDVISPPPHTHGQQTSGP